MKFLDFYKSSRKCFSIKKFIKPLHSQEFYNSMFYQRIKDKKKVDQNVSNQSIFATKMPLHPDQSKSLDAYDDQSEHFMYHINKRTRELEERTNSHIALAKAAMAAKNSKKAFPSKTLRTEEVGGETDVSVDKDTSLVYGVGFDKYITATLGSNQKTSKSSEERQLEDLVAKLGYVDFRDFVALNKYILEAHNHEDLVNQTKSKFLSLAMQKMNVNQKDDIKKSFKKIDEQNKELKPKDRNEIKLDFMFNNVKDSKELFYNYYYKLKELNERDDSKTLTEFEKYDQMIKNLNNPKTKKSDLDDLYTKKANQDDNLAYDLNDYMERIIKTYREQRTISIQTDSETIINKLRYLKQKLVKETYINEETLYSGAITLAKYQTFIAKYKKVYVPTNIETERLINKYLREKRIKEFTKEKMMSDVDPYFSPLTDEDDMVNNDSIYDEESKLRAMEKHKLKDTYFEAKYQYQLKELEDNVDKQLADELGVILTKEAHEKRYKDIDEFDQISFAPGKDSNMKFIESFVNDHYRSFKLDFMYNYLDFFSNKYKVRRRIAEELKGRVSLKEINYILNNLVAKETGKFDINKKTQKYSVHDFIKSQFGVINPNYIEVMTETSTDNPVLDKERRNSILSAMNHVDNQPLELDEKDKFEVELYKGIKNDPYFKHYLYNNFAYFAETMNDMIAGSPFISRGHKPQDYVRYTKLPTASKKQNELTETQKAQAISESKSDMLDSLDTIVNNQLVSGFEEKEKERSYFGMGKRKRAKAWVEMYPGKGTITVNGRNFYDYFNFSVNRGKVLIPLQLTDTVCQYDLKIKVQGGGTTGQTEAIIPAISKALIQINPEWRQILSKHILLIHDPRNVEPKKPGKIKARKGYVYNRR